MTKARKAFESKCDKVSERLDIGVTFFELREGDKPRCDEDDGHLHIVRSGVRACFDVGKGQSLSAKEQNKNTVAVLTELGLAAHADSESVLVDEDEDEDETGCPHCGRGY